MEWTCEKCEEVEPSDNEEVIFTCKCLKGGKIDLNRVVSEVEKIINNKMFSGKRVVRVVPVDDNANSDSGKSE